MAVWQHEMLTSSLYSRNDKHLQIFYKKRFGLCDLRLPPGFQYEIITFGLLPSVALSRFLTNVSGPYIRPICRVK